MAFFEPLDQAISEARYLRLLLVVTINLKILRWTGSLGLVDANSYT